MWGFINALILFRRLGWASCDGKLNFNSVFCFVVCDYAGTYKYCYHGFYSSNCSIDLSLKFAKEKVLVHSALPMDCKEYKFNKSFDNVLWQERNYKVFVSCHFPKMSNLILCNNLYHWAFKFTFVFVVVRLSWVSPFKLIMVKLY